MLDKMLEKYREKFGEGFPTFQIGRGKSDEELSDIVQGCIDRGKDAYDSGLVADDEDTLY